MCAATRRELICKFARTLPLITTCKSLLRTIIGCEWHWSWTDGRCLLRSPPGAGCVAFLVRRIGCQPESESVPVQQQHEQKRVHHFLVIIFSDPRSRQCPRCCHLRTREGGSLLISAAPAMATKRCDDEDAGGDLAWPGWCINSSGCCLSSVSSRGSMNGWLGRRRRMGMRSHS